MAATVADLQARLSIDLADVRGKLDTAMKGLAETQKATEKLAKGLGEDVAKGAKAGGESLAGFGASLRRVIETAAGFNLAGLFEQATAALKDFLVESSKLGREQQLQEATFKQFAASVGVAGDVLAAQIEQVTGGIIDSGDAMKIAMRGLTEGLQPQQLVTLADAARQLAKSLQVDAVEAYKDLTEAIATGQSRRLKDIGITIDQEQALKDYAASIGTTADQLTTADKTQALFVATMAKAAPVVEANRKVNDEFGEALQRLKVAWQDVKETVGVALNQGLLQVGQWFADMKAAILPQFTAAFEQLTVIFAATGKNALAALAPIQHVLVNLIVPALKLAVAAAASFMVGLNAAFTAVAGPLAYLGSLLSDLAEKKFRGMFTRATLEANVATAEARVRLAEAVEAYQKLAWGSGEAAKKQDEVKTATNAGTNALGDQSKQVKAATVDLKALQSALQGVADAYRALSTEAAKNPALNEDFDKLVEPLEQMRAKMREAAAAAGVNKDAIQKLDAALAQYQRDLVAEVMAKRDVIAATKAETDARVEGWATAAQSYDATQAAAEALAGAYDALLGAGVEAWAGTNQLAGELRKGLTDAAQEAEQELAALKETLGLTGIEAEATRKYLAAFGKSLVDLTEADRQRIREMVAAKKQTANLTAEQAYLQALIAIETQAKLFGPTYDAVGARLAEVRKEMLRLAADTTGSTAPAVAALKAEFDHLTEIQDTKAIFVDLFGSITGGIGKMIEGLQLGTRSWKDMGTMALEVIRAVAAELLNRLLKKALDPVLDKLATIAAAGLTGGAGRGGLGSGLAPGGSAINVDPETGEMAGGFQMPSLPSGIFDTGTLSTLWNGLGNAWEAFNVSLGYGNTAITSFGDSLSAFANSFSGAASGLTVALAGVGAAVAVFGTIMDFVNGNTEAAIGGVVGGVTGAVAGGLIGSAFPGIGTVLGALAGGALGDWLGSMLGGLFGGPSAYDLKRMAAADEANAALGNVTGGYQNALRTGNPAQILAALQGGGGGNAGNSVRSELVLPTGLAQQIGLAGQQIGDQIVTQWADVTLEQFQAVIAAMKENPDLVNAIRGSGDVPYLSASDAQAVADQIAQGAQALLSAFVQMEQVRDKITQLAVDLTEATADVLPPDLAAQVASGIIDPIRDRMLAVLDSGLGAEEMQAQLDALAQELGQFVGLVTLYGTLEQDIATLSNDLATKTRGAVLGIQAMLEQTAKAVEDAEARVAKAVTPEETLAATAALRQAILDRYTTEMNLIAKIQQAIAGLLESVGKPAMQNAAAAAGELLRQGDAAPFNAIYASLVEMANAAPTLAQRLFGISQGIDLVLQALPATVGFLSNGASLTNGREGGLPIPQQIVDTLNTQAAPFFAALADVLAEARANGDLEGQLGALQAQAQLIQQVATAAIEAVQAWAQAAIDAAEEAAAAMEADIRKNYDALRDFINQNADDHIKAIEAQRDADIAANQALIDANQAAIDANNLTIKNNNLRLEGIAAEQAALQEALATAQAWRQAMTGMTDFITGLERGLMSPEMRFTAAQGDYQAALARYRANPSAAGLTEVQQLAQALLQAAGAIPGAGTEGLTRAIIADLKAAQGLAPDDMVDALTSQLDALAAERKAIEAANKELADANAKLTEANQALADLNDKIRADAQVNIDWWEAWRRDKLNQAAEDEAHDIALVAKWKQAQIDAINETAQKTIDNIKAGTAAALLDNAKEQNRIMNLLIVSQMDQLRAITGGMPVQDFIAQESHKAAVALQDIQKKISDFLVAAASGPPPPGNALGLEVVPRTMTTTVHAGEGILNAEENRAYREGGGGAVTIHVHQAPGESWADLEQKLEHAIRWGRLGKVIKGKA